MDPRGFPTSLPEFQKAFPDDAMCAAYLEHLRWPHGFICPVCGAAGVPYRFPKRKSIVLRCRGCLSNVSLTAGTVMQGTRTPLPTWFWGAYLVSTQTPGMSALQFQRQLGLSRYETAFQILHKLRAGLVRPDRDLIGKDCPVEVDETLVGGRTRGEGKGIHHKVTVVAAVEVRKRSLSANRMNRQEHLYAGRLRLRLIPNRGAVALTKFVSANVVPGAVVRTDGWEGYKTLCAMGYAHEPMALRGDGAKVDVHLPLVHITFSNLKTWLMGTHHGVSKTHLPAYLNEFVFRFNRRFYPMTAFNSALGLAAHASSPTYKSLYDGRWTHPAA